MENKKYIVIVETTYLDLVESVNRKIEEGYKCQGGIMVTNNENTFHGYIRQDIGYYQAMVKYYEMP